MARAGYLGLRGGGSLAAWCKSVRHLVHFYGYLALSDGESEYSIAGYLGLVAHWQPRYISS